MFSSNTSQVSNDVKYIEDFCSVYLRTGTGSSQTVTTGVKENTGALVISKSRSAATDWAWYDTFRGTTYDLVSNSTAAQTTQAQGLTSFNADGHTWGTLAKVNTSGATYVDTVLKPTPKFFDVVTYTGDGTAGRTVSHNLGSVPGCIIVKSTTSSAYPDWLVYHRSTGNTGALSLNTTNDAAYGGTFWNSTTPTSSVFTLGDSPYCNQSGTTYVAYLFAHNAGGFGLTGTDNVISCGSAVTSGGALDVNLGYEPQWLLLKRSDGVGNWQLLDTMRGWNMGIDAVLYPNLSDAETGDYLGNPTATGFNIGGFANGLTYIYIAIRRGPMKTPTSGTSVFSPNIATTNIQSGTQLPSAGFPVDLQIGDWRNGAYGAYATDRLRGGAYSYTFSTGAEGSSLFAFDSMTNVRGTGNFESSSNPFVFWQFRRAPGFFDEVCYTGTGVARTVAHNLAAVPELMIVKRRDSTSLGALGWAVWSKSITQLGQYGLSLNTTDSVINTYGGAFAAYNTAPSMTSTTFSLGNYEDVNVSGGTYVAYLFASCPGVSKVGSVTHVEPTTVVCGFTPRFVLIKSTATTGTDDWFVFDSARGITSGNDPYLRLNSTGAENTPFGAADLIDPTADGFIMNGFGGGNYIYLAIA